MEIDNNNGDAYYYRGLAKVKLNNYREAIEDYNLAIERDSSNAEYHRARGDARSKAEDNQGAIAGYEGRGNLKAEMGNKAGAIQDYQKAIAIGAKSGENYWTKQANESLKTLQGK